MQRHCFAGEMISVQRARKLVSRSNWLRIQRGFVVYSRNMKWRVSKVGHGLYKRVPCYATW